MYPSLVFCTAFLMVTILAEESPPYLNYYQKLVDIFTQNDTLFDGFYDFEDSLKRITKCKVTFFTPVTLIEKNSRVEIMDDGTKLCTLAFSIHLTRISTDDGRTDWSILEDCSVRAQFSVNNTSNGVDITPVQVVYDHCAFSSTSIDLNSLSQAVTRRAKVALSRQHGREFKFKIMQEKLDRYLYWA